MSSIEFKFKQFSVRHDRCAMKVGTDGVLLGAWSDVAGACRVLDVGTGTGLVALMLAQRSSADIMALDIDSAAVLQAKENVEKSPWEERIDVMDQDFRNFHPSVRFDRIVANPPYFIDSLECPEKQRTIARHNTDLNYYELLAGVERCLDRMGRFCVIIPADASGSMKSIAEGFGLYPLRQLNVITTPGKLPKRVLLEFVFDSEVKCMSNDMLIEVQRHTYSPEYIELTQAYYLNM